MEGGRKALCIPKIKALAVDEEFVGQTSGHIFLPIIPHPSAEFITLRAPGLLTVCAPLDVYRAFVKTCPYFFAELYWFTYYSRWVGFPPSLLLNYNQSSEYSLYF